MKSATTETQRITVDLDRDLYEDLVRRAADNKVGACGPSTISDLCRDAIAIYMKAAPTTIDRLRKRTRE